jgi:hypothetical protein
MVDMAPASWIQRVGAACAAMAMALALLSPPPSRAVPEGTGGSPSHEIGTGGSALVGAGPSTTTRSAENTLVSLRVAAAQKIAESSTSDLRFVQAGSEAPAVIRWRIAHSTSTSNP